jgi:hypothetical protein
LIELLGVAWEFDNPNARTDDARGFAGNLVRFFLLILSWVLLVVLMPNFFIVGAANTWDADIPKITDINIKNIAL